MNKKVLRSLSYGVYITAAMDSQRPTGCVTNSVMQITSSPATVAVSVNHDNYTNGCIQKSGMFSVSVLAVDSDSSLIGRFGFQSGKDVDKFQGIPYETVEGVPVINDGCGYVVCRVIDKMETSSHTVFLGEVIEGEVGEKIEPMTYAYYHNVIKGKSPKNAPTYIPEEKAEPKSEGKVKYVCSVCGFEYYGDPLPEDYVCPICHQPASVFNKVVE